MKLLKKNYKLISGIIIGVVFASIGGYAATSYAIESNKVSYTDNAKLGVDNVQAAIDGTCASIDTRLGDIEDSMFITKEYYASYTAAANAEKTININVELSGYTPLGIIGLYTWNGQIYPVNFSIASDGTKANVTVKNTLSAEQTSNLQIRVLYKKTTS